MQVDIAQLEWRRMAIRARGNEIIVDDTLETGGPGDGWRPSELLLGGLGACMIGTMLTFAKNQGIEPESFSWTPILAGWIQSNGTVSYKVNHFTPVYFPGF